MRKIEKPTFAVTLGDPNGIGPELVFKALQDPQIRNRAHWIVYGQKTRKKCPDNKAGELSLQALYQAVVDVQNGLCDALITAPISKENIHKAGFKFPGHTEFLENFFKAKKTVMMFISPKLKVSLVTIHEPLARVPKLITSQKVFDTILLTHQSLKKDFKIRHPKIAVCGLNPHAGEKGLFGKEELKIAAAVKKAQKKGIKLFGPLPSDTLFHQAAEGKYDAVIAMYHDQGLIPVKTLDFHHGVNMTLGLPIIRTSPDQGCAFDIAGKGIANPSSMKEAMKLAVTVWHQRNSRIGL